METSKTRKHQSFRGSHRGSSRNRSHILERKRRLLSGSKATPVSGVRSDRTSDINSINVRLSIKPSVVAYHQNGHPVFGKDHRIPFVEHLYQCLSNHSYWEDLLEWAPDTSPEQVSKVLVEELDGLLSTGTHLHFDQTTAKLSFLEQFDYQFCHIPVSCFLPQLQVFNPLLYKLVATTISHISAKCGFQLWDHHLEQDAVRFCKQILEENDDEFDEEHSLKDMQVDVDRWNDVIFPYAREIRSIAKKVTIDKLIDKVDDFNWPNTFTAKRMYLWFQRAFNLIKSDFNVRTYTYYDPSDHRDGTPLFPEDAFKFTWSSYQDASVDGPVNRYFTEFLNDQWGNFGTVLLSKKHAFDPSWEIRQNSFKVFQDFCESTNFLWLNPDHRDFYRIRPVETCRQTEVTHFNETIIYYEPISWKPKQCTL